MVLDDNKETFVMHIATLLVFLKILIHSFQIVLITLLLADKTLVKVFFGYFDYTDIFLHETVAQLLEYIRINDYTINL